MATEMTGIAMKSSIASAEGRMNQKNVPCFTPAPGERSKEWGPASAGPRSMSRSAEEAAFLGCRFVRCVDVLERLLGVLGPLEEIADLIAERGVQQTLIGQHRVRRGVAVGRGDHADRRRAGLEALDQPGSDDRMLGRDVGADGVHH